MWHSARIQTTRGGCAAVSRGDEVTDGGVEERNPKAIPITGTVCRALGIALGLFQDVLRIDRNLLGFDDAQQNTIHEQGVISRAIVSRKFGDGMTSELRHIEPILPRDNFPRLVMAQSLADQHGKFPLATFRIAAAKENPNLTDIQMVRETADGTTIVYARMVDDNGWKFDDIYIAQAKGQPIKIWLSEAVENPLGTALGLVDWHQAAANANTFLDLCQKFKQTFGEDCSSNSE